MSVLGRYRIIREIARSNDIVYEAVDSSINRRVALKELVVPPNLTGEQREERVGRFYREARAAGSLSHPNIVTIYEAGEDQGRHFIAMEFLEGQTLRTMIDTQGKLPEERAVTIVKEVCDALSYAHAHGVVHRDIKPDNIQILPNGHVKITDFGIARLMEEPSLTANGQVFGTPSYMSPEQIAGKPFDCRTDIFSLGIVFYEMLFGKKPFGGDSVVTITYNIMNQEFFVPPGTPAYLTRVLTRCLAKDAGMRYSSAAELVQELDMRTSSFMPSSTIAMTSMPQIPAQQMPVPQPAPIPMKVPRLPRMPAVSPEARYFLNIMFAVIAVCAFIIGVIWALNAGYAGYQDRLQEGKVAAHLQRGKEYFDQESFQAAAEEFSQALKLTSDAELQKKLRENIAVCYISIGDRSLNNGDMQTAMDWWSKAGSISPESPAVVERTARVYLLYGNRAAQSGDVNTAMDWWQKAQEIGPGTQSGVTAGENIRRFMGSGYGQ